MCRWGKNRNENRPESGGKVAVQTANHADSLAIQCPLCGKRFQPGEAVACGSCLLAAKCGLVMCPNCSYEFPA